MVTLATKLLQVVIAKMANFIPGGGIWLNTQRPEWNDANNALAGYGLSMVTLYYLHRFVKFLISIFEASDTVSFTLPSAVAGDEGLKRFAALVRAYFDHKGYHIQFNIVDRATLLEAQKHPEQHKDLIVRVAGYSAQFVVLAKDVQDDIIARTEQTFE